MTQRLARYCAGHPWRVVVTWLTTVVQAAVARMLVRAEASGGVEPLVDPAAPAAAQVSADRGSLLPPLRLAEPGVRAGIAGEYTLAHDPNEISERDLRNGEFRIGLPAALIVLVLVFGALVAAALPLVLAIVSIAVALGLTALVSQRSAAISAARAVATIGTTPASREGLEDVARVQVRHATLQVGGRHQDLCRCRPALGHQGPVALDEHRLAAGGGRLEHRQRRRSIAQAETTEAGGDGAARHEDGAAPGPRETRDLDRQLPEYPALRRRRGRGVGFPSTIAVSPSPTDAGSMTLRREETGWCHAHAGRYHRPSSPPPSRGRRVRPARGASADGTRLEKHRARNITSQAPRRIPVADRHIRFTSSSPASRRVGDDRPPAGGLSWDVRSVRTITGRRRWRWVIFDEDRRTRLSGVRFHASAEAALEEVVDTIAGMKTVEGVDLADLPAPPLADPGPADDRPPA